MNTGTTSVWCMVAALTVAGVGCGSDDSDPVVGSQQLDERTTEVMFVEKMRISLPFRTVVLNGEPGQVLIRGEDNLISKIDVEETEMGEWDIVASPDLEFEQHYDVQIEVPFIEMVEITIDGDITFEDDPIKVWNESDKDASSDGGV